jgi:hypothetical protein
MVKKATKASKASKNTSATTRKRKRKKTRYHTGVHNSPKCNAPINYRSGWEYTVCKYLDNDPSVLAYAYESIEIRYTSNQTTKRLRKYLPDFLIWYADGKVKMVEVKRQNQLTNLRVQRKAEAAKIWCASQKPEIIYEFWTDKIVLPLQKAEKIRQRYLSKK